MELSGTLQDRILERKKTARNVNSVITISVSLSDAMVTARFLVRHGLGGQAGERGRHDSV
jgi:hypothetical protein